MGSAPILQKLSAIAERPGLRERSRLRSRARHLRALREVQLRDLGGIVLELARAGRERADLVAEKVAVLARTDEELRGLAAVLGDLSAEAELRAPGSGGSCPRCHAVHGSADRFCAACGTELGGPAA